MIAEWFVLCKSPEETSNNKHYSTTSRTVKYWRGDLTNQLREYKYRHIKPIFRSDYSDHSFQNNRFLFLNFPIDGKVENGQSNDWNERLNENWRSNENERSNDWTVRLKNGRLTLFLKWISWKWTVKRLKSKVDGFLKMYGQCPFQRWFLKLDSPAIEIKSGCY